MRLSYKGLKVLATFAANIGRPMAGSDLYRETGIGSGTLYPILMRFERCGWLEAEWEKIDPAEAGRPAKHLYRLTPFGLAAAREHMGELRMGDIAWAF